MELNYILDLKGRQFEQPQYHFECNGYGTVLAKKVEQTASEYQKADEIIGCKKIYRTLNLREDAKNTNRKMGGTVSSYEARNYSGGDNDTHEHGYEVYVLRTEQFAVENPFGETQYFTAKHITHGWDIPEDWYDGSIQKMNAIPSVETSVLLSFPDLEPQTLNCGRKSGAMYAMISEIQVEVSTWSHKAIPNVLQTAPAIGENRMLYFSEKIMSNFDIMQMKWAKEKGEMPKIVAKSAKTVEFKRLGDNHTIEFYFGNKILRLNNCYDFNAEDSGVIVLGKYEANRGTYTYSVSIPDGIEYQIK